MTAAGTVSRAGPRKEAPVAEDRWRFRPRASGCNVTHAEYIAIRAICTDLGLTVRDVLLIGLRRCQVRLARERRRQRLLEEERDN